MLKRSGDDFHAACDNSLESSIDTDDDDIPLGSGKGLVLRSLPVRGIRSLEHRRATGSEVCYLILAWVFGIGGLKHAEL